MFRSLLPFHNNSLPVYLPAIVGHRVLGGRQVGRSTTITVTKESTAAVLLPMINERNRSLKLSRFEWTGGCQWSEVTVKYRVSLNSTSIPDRNALPRSSWCPTTDRLLFNSSTHKHSNKWQSELNYYGRIANYCVHRDEDDKGRLYLLGCALVHHKPL